MKTRYYLLILSFVIISCKKTKSPVTELLSPNAQNKAAYLKKLDKGVNLKIVCEGTSLTYGQNEPGPLPPIHGASQTRSLYQYPSSLEKMLLANKIHAQVINRGFPGDRTTEGLSRWRDSTIADVVIIEYATNDAFNFGGYPSGALKISAFTDSLSKIVDRRIKQGAWVILTSPPKINAKGYSLVEYRKAIVAVSKKFDTLIFDVQKDAIESDDDYYDGIHLTGLAAQRWGVNIAPLLYKK